jgi:hypothetical protein
VQSRYPGAETTRQWELWNEPDIGYWHGTFDEFTRLYDTDRGRAARRHAERVARRPLVAKSAARSSPNFSNTARPVRTPQPAKRARVSTW